MHCCDGLVSSTATASLQLPKYTSPNHISFTTHLLLPNSKTSKTLKAKATTKNHQTFTKPISEMSFYDLLGIPETVTLTEIKQAYKSLARKYHPDVSPPDLVHEYTERFIRVQEAYETLSDPKTRSLYDRDLAKGLHLAFSSRRKNLHHYDDEEVEDKSDWRIRWQGQVSELKKRSMYRDAGGNMSWGARMRQRNATSSES